MECLSCGSSIAEADRFCGACGAPAPVLCAACGAGNVPGRNFCGACGAPLAAAPRGPAAPRARAAAAEHRQVTVLFCDLVGSTPLSQRLDPEELSDVIAAYQAGVGELVARFGGVVAQYLGDGVLAYFGYPHAHEDDAERAARAGLALLEAVSELKPSPGLRLQVRIGIATGSVIIGELAEGASAGGVGETLNLAARLQGLAAPGTVLVCARTRRLVGRHFEFAELGRVALKGFAEPVEAYRVLRASTLRSRFSALHEGKLTPLVGREEELELMLRRWRQAKAGEGRVLLLSGEPGIGKSRLCRALKDRIAAEPHTPICYDCSPHDASSALFPVISEIARAAGFAPADTPGLKRQKLAQLLAQTGTAAEDVELLAELLAPAPGGDGAFSEWSPHRRKERTLEALLTQLRLLSEQQPVLVLFEDLHWLDPTSLELLTLVVERVARWRVLLVLTARPEFSAPWPPYAHVTTLSLTRFSQPDGQTLIRMVTKGKGLPAPLLDRILDRADGVPLFIEELTKAVVEGALMREDAIPATLQALLLARLDRHASAREVAQIGAAIGREFSYALVSAVADLPEKSLREALDVLAEAELVFRRGELPETFYRFKHALVRDVAYGTMLRSRRLRLHARIAEVFSADPAVAERQPERVAEHFAEAGAAEAAVGWWMKAGQMALARSANPEAAAHLRKALDLVEAWPQGAARDRQELELLGMLGTALIATHGYGAAPTLSAYERGLQLVRATGDRRRQDAIFSGVFVAYYNRAAFDKGLEVGREFLDWAEDSRDPLALCIGHRMVAASHNALGDFATAARHGEAAVRHYDPERHAPLAWRYIHDIGVAAMCHCGAALWHLGHLRRAAAMTAEMMALAARLKHRNTMGYALFYAALAALRNGDLAALGEHAACLQRLGREHNLPHWLAWGLAFAAPVQLADGDPLAALGDIDDAIAMADRMRVLVFRPMLLGFRAEALAAAHHGEDALHTVEEALALAERTGEHGHRAELWRLKGVIALEADEPETLAAEDALARAIDIARDQGSVMLALSASLSLARLWRRRGARDDAAALLASACGRVVEPARCRTLEAATALLGELRASPAPALARAAVPQQAGARQ